ncbi:hypothetical protein V6237_08085 [Pseudoalteromonas carrageenovora]|uniref:hypothetical protein n=1 Tax=Pseudoalteromonas carrageenovora TaxID=227 RepID=UPI00311E7047
MQNIFITVITASLVLLTGCTNGEIKMTSFKKFKPADDKGHPFHSVFFNLEGNNKQEYCEISFPGKILENKAEIDGPGINNLMIGCSFDGYKNVGMPITSEYFNTTLKFIGGNKATFNFHGELVADHGVSYEARTVGPVEFEYSL